VSVVERNLHIGATIPFLPDNLAGFGPTFRFPFQTIEAVIPLSNTRLGVLNDNNYPFSSGRVAGQPDPNEFIILRLDRPLSQAHTSL
jgi:hypothetical protein